MKLTLTDRQLDLIEQALECFIDGIEPEDGFEGEVEEMQAIRTYIAMVLISHGE